MKNETILNAMVMADRRRIAPSYLKHLIRNSQRQYHAFRARILFDFATREAAIDLCQQRLREKDAEIERLKYDLDWNINIIEQMRKWRE